MTTGEAELVIVTVNEVVTVGEEPSRPCIVIVKL